MVKEQYKTLKLTQAKRLMKSLHKSRYKRCSVDPESVLRCGANSLLYLPGLGPCLPCLGCISQAEAAAGLNSLLDFGICVCIYVKLKSWILTLWWHIHIYSYLHICSNLDKLEYIYIYIYVCCRVKFSC